MDFFYHRILDFELSNIVGLKPGDVPTKVGITTIYSVFYKIKILVTMNIKLVWVKLGGKNQSLGFHFLIINKTKFAFFSCKTT